MGKIIVQQLVTLGGCGGESSRSHSARSTGDPEWVLHRRHASPPQQDL